MKCCRGSGVRARSARDEGEIFNLDPTASAQTNASFHGVKKNFVRSKDEVKSKVFEIKNRVGYLEVTRKGVSQRNVSFDSLHSPYFLWQSPHMPRQVRVEYEDAILSCDGAWQPVGQDCAD